MRKLGWESWRILVIFSLSFRVVGMLFTSPNKTFLFFRLWLLLDKEVAGQVFFFFFF